jgi:Tol biopolymer transport system component
LVYSVAGKIHKISSTGGSPTALPLPPTGLVVGYIQPAWSPDGKRIVCTGLVGPGIATSQIWSLDPTESDPIPVTEGKHLDHNPVWAPDGKHMFFISDRGGNSDVWWMPVDEGGSPTGQATPLTAGSGVGAIALSTDGTRLAYTKAIDRSNIWSIPIVPDRILKLSEARPLTSENHYIESLHISPDGQWIAFDTNRRGNMDIWIMRKDGSESRQLTTNQAHDWYPQWSPDGKKILFHSLRHGNRDLFVIPAAGGALQQLTEHPAQDLAAVWSPDQKKIAFLSNRSGNMDAWLMLSEGRIIEQLTLEDAQEFILLWSRDGKEIAFCSNRTGYYELFMIASDQYFISDKKIIPLQITRGEWTSLSPLYWTRDKQTIFAYGVGGPYNQGTNLWAVSVSDGSARPLIDFQNSLKEPSHVLSSDGERIYFPLIECFGDLWMAELSVDE